MFARNISVRLKPNTVNAFNQTFEKEVVLKSQKYLLALAVMVLSFLYPPAADAGTITFFDLTDTVTASASTDIAGRVFIFNCGPGGGPAGECLMIQLMAPVGFHGGANWVNADILEPITGALSDTLQIYPLLDANSNISSLVITFTSDEEGGSPLGSTGGTLITENGLIQKATDVSWGDGTVDTIQFQSDVEVTTPEPSSLLLLGSGLFGLAGVVRRKLPR